MTSLSELFAAASRTARASEQRLHKYWLSGAKNLLQGRFSLLSLDFGERKIDSMESDGAG